MFALAEDLMHHDVTAVLLHRWRYHSGDMAASCVSLTLLMSTKGDRSLTLLRLDRRRFDLAILSVVDDVGVESGVVNDAAFDGGRSGLEKELEESLEEMLCDWTSCRHRQMIVTMVMIKCCITYYLNLLGGFQRQKYFQK